MGDELMKKVKNNEKKPTAYTPSPQKSLIKTQYDHLDQSSTVEQIEAQLSIFTLARSIFILEI